MTKARPTSDAVKLARIAAREERDRQRAETLRTVIENPVVELVSALFLLEMMHRNKLIGDPMLVAVGSTIGGCVVAQQLAKNPLLVKGGLDVLGKAIGAGTTALTLGAVL